MPGTGCCALPDSVRLTAHAVRRGCAGVLMLPPFYYKGVTDDGLFRGFAEVIERVGDDRLRVYLYHIPPVAQVGIGPKLVERLLKAYPGAVAGDEGQLGRLREHQGDARTVCETGSTCSPAARGSSSRTCAAAASAASPRPGT